MRAAKVQGSLRIRAVSPKPSLLAHTSSEWRGNFRQKARSLAPLNGWACAVKTCHDGMLEDTNSLDAAHTFKFVPLWMMSTRYNFSQHCLMTWEFSEINWDEIWLPQALTGIQKNNTWNNTRVFYDLFLTSHWTVLKQFETHVLYMQLKVRTKNFTDIIDFAWLLLKKTFSFFFLFFVLLLNLAFRPFKTLSLLSSKAYKVGRTKMEDSWG